MDTSRIQWIDYAKAMAIFGVVLLHANISYPARGIIHVGLIPLFMFLSGIFANTERYDTFKDFMRHKGLHLLVPYVCFNIIAYLFWLCAGRYYGYDVQTDVEWWRPLLGIVYGEYSHLIHYIPMWFMACLISVEILFYLIFRHIRSSHAYGLTVLAIAVLGGLNYYFNPVALPWGLSSAFPMMVFYAAGHFFASPIRNNDYRVLTIPRCWIGWVLGAVIVLLIYWLNPGEVKVFINSYGSYGLFYIGAFAYILHFMCLCRLLEHYFGKITWLSYIGSNTLIILCLHLMVFSLIKGITYFIFRLPLEIYQQTWLVIASSVLNILLLVPVMMLINRYCPFLIGQFHRDERKS